MLRADTFMKKLLLGVALACFPLLTQAQGGFQIGIKGGVNLSRLTLGNFANTSTNPNGSPSVGVDGQTFRNNISASLDSRTGYSFGLYTRFGKNLFLQPELLYTTTEGQLEIVRNGATEIVTVKSSSFDVPVLIGLKGGPLRFVVGPMASFRIDNNAGLSDALKQYTSGTLNDAWSKAYYSYQIGGGLDLGKLGLDVRHIGNLSDVVQVNGSSGSFGQRTKSWQITLAYKLF
jgi:hypothetical protein